MYCPNIFSSVSPDYVHPLCHSSWNFTLQRFYWFNEQNLLKKKKGCWAIRQLHIRANKLNEMIFLIMPAYNRKMNLGIIEHDASKELLELKFPQHRKPASGSSFPRSLKQNLGYTDGVVSVETSWFPRTRELGRVSQWKLVFMKTKTSHTKTKTELSSQCSSGFWSLCALPASYS